ncbi:hypothetical protein HNP48_001938 [Acidovorax soli]|uniref:ORC1/DEAH AAA+ ATPase domain-containing protein n=1 Tax=Acidovorax soli TaxID=592050 RepID=A0A7X0PCF3_9BURK|nr:AAA family ATPase [Acidovorax soli]MBB6559271.1 hypothetical protein [Acidovorax soli]
MIRELGEIHPRSKIAKLHLELPPLPPSNIATIPRHIRLHMLMALRRFHVPSLEGLRLHESVDLMMRQNYSYIDPSSPNTWSLVSGEPSLLLKRSKSPTFAAAVEGVSGSGKTQAVLRCLETYPQQWIHHSTFVRMTGGHYQMAWLSADVPPSGHSAPLAAALMTNWKRVTGSSRFDKTLEGNWRNGAKMLEEWRQVASAHFLGLLHLDEIQNFFKISTLSRRKRQKSGDAPPELSIVEDQCLKWILDLMNNWQIPLLVSGTPDGIGALTNRLSNTGRFVSSGYHAFKHFTAASDPAFRDIFFAQLIPYQYVANPLPASDGLAQLIIEKTAGVQRLIIALWIAAHRVAFERSKSDELRLDDFLVAADTFLAPVAPAVAALRSNDPNRMRRYEDLTSRDQTFWTQFWGEVASD